MLKEFKKSDLKNGMVVETRNGHLYLWHIQDEKKK